MTWPLGRVIWWNYLVLEKIGRNHKTSTSFLWGIRSHIVMLSILVQATHLSRISIQGIFELCVVTSRKWTHLWIGILKKLLFWIFRILEFCQYLPNRFTLVAGSCQHAKIHVEQTLHQLQIQRQIGVQKTTHLRTNKILI